mmetsp:Transcript_5944/g.14759  ORF Transcript_5944/g.14759 Transcript_5944/m.14759 type:complete len:303 (+) Transcript_5944:675-1583(+)
MYFRELIEATHDEHTKASRKGKCQITWQVVRDIEAQNGRFLEWCPKRELWVVIRDREKIRTKVAHCYKQFHRSVTMQREQKRKQQRLQEKRQQRLQLQSQSQSQTQSQSQPQSQSQSQSQHHVHSPSAPPPTPVLRTTATASAASTTTATFTTTIATTTTTLNQSSSSALSRTSRIAFADKKLQDYYSGRDLEQFRTKRQKTASLDCSAACSVLFCSPYDGGSGSGSGKTADYQSINQKIGAMAMARAAQQQNGKDDTDEFEDIAIEEDPQGEPPGVLDFAVAMFYVLFGLVAMIAGLGSIV